MKIKHTIIVLLILLPAFSFFKSFSQQGLTKISAPDSIFMARMREISVTPSFSTGKSLNNDRPSKPVQKVNFKINDFIPTAAAVVSCADTSTSLTYTSGIDSLTLIVADMVAAKNGDYIVTGTYTDRRTNQIEFCNFIMRIDSAFQPLWIKKYKPIGPFTGYWYKVKELNDNSILVAGNFYTAGYSMYGLNVARVAMDGNLLWNKTFLPRPWLQNAQAYCWIEINQLMQDADNSIYISCRERGNTASVNNGLLVKLNLSGNILWDRSPTEAGKTTGYLGSVIRGDKVITFGRTAAWSPGIPIPFGGTGIYMFNKATGNLVQYRTYNQVNNPGIGQHWGYFLDLTEMNNGDVSMSGRLLGEFNNDPQAAASMQFKTTDLSFVKGNTYHAIYAPAVYRTRLKIFPDGNSFFSYADFPNPYTHNVFFIQSYNGTIVRQRSKEYKATGTDYQTTAIQKSPASYVFMQHKYDSADNFLRSNELFKLNISDSNSACLGTDINACFISEINVEDAQTSFTDSGRNVLIDTLIGTLAVSNITIQRQQNCTQVVKCDSLKIVADFDTLCNTANPVLVTALRNKNCRSIINWSSNSSLVQSIQPITDSSALVWINSGSGQCYISGSFNSSCGVLSDSVKLTKLQFAPELDLGPDLEICGNGSFILNAHAGFKNYLWQDNSTDSTFFVTGQGLYNVTVTDYCNTVFSDTVLAITAQPEPLDLGIDTSICNKDTAILIAPAGFMAYNWLPDYKISSTTSQVIKVYPDKTTKYYLSAQKNPGCISTDSINISVYATPNNFILHDTLICQRENIILQPTALFKDYLWSTGSTAVKVSINLPGIYWLQVKDHKGCTAKEFINVNLKPCLGLVYFPNSFTPNDDGKNDMFKAGVYGMLKLFNMAVYNRYGQKVFETSDADFGWDGLFHGKKQDQGIYTWIAKYQLEGKQPEEQKGTILLIR